MTAFLMNIDDVHKYVYWEVGDEVDVVSEYDVECEVYGTDDSGNDYRGTAYVSCGDIIEILEFSILN